MNTNVFRISILALTLVLLAMPLTAAARGLGDDLGAGTATARFEGESDDPFWGVDIEDIAALGGDQLEYQDGYVVPNARYQIFVKPDMNLAAEIKFIEDNSWDYDAGYTIDVIFPAQPAEFDPLSPPDGISTIEWIRFIESNFVPVSIDESARFVGYPDRDDVSQVVGAPVNY